MRFLPRSLLGQVLLATAAALLIAQAISTSLLYRAAEQRRELALTNAVAFQLIRGTARGEDRRTGMVRFQNDRPGAVSPRPLRRLRYMESAKSPLLPDDVRLSRREAELTRILQAQGLVVDDVIVVTRPMIGANARQARQRSMLIAGVRQEGSAVWHIVRLPIPQSDRAIFATLLVQTVILFSVLVGLLYLVLRRITRPLAALAESTARFGGAGAPDTPIPASGPQDVRRLIDAHNAMQARIGSMLDEKDVMLGAIGHDLKTPLAALRVRIESVTDDAARSKMADTIEEITHTLDDILSLARVGRRDAEPERIELSALAASVVEEFEDMGQPVTLAARERIAASVHLTWLKRGMRNLVTNALRYAGTARVSVLREDGFAILRVEDDGPGIPDDRIADMLEPFTRGEASRNRETGGAGLGLTLARAVAEQHGGTLVLSNRPEGGLRAEFRLPL